MTLMLVASAVAVSAALVAWAARAEDPRQIHSEAENPRQIHSEVSIFDEAAAD